MKRKRLDEAKEGEEKEMRMCVFDALFVGAYEG